MPRLFRRVLFLILFLICLTFFVPTNVRAASKDQRCWQKNACESDSGFFYGPNAETIKACKMEKDAAGVTIGFCTATGSAETNVGFGGAGKGERSFENIGKFIQWIYRYGIMSAGLLTMFMLVLSGLQWATSAGSPERITAAKKRIGGALMGLFVALLSYTVLNTVNPFLVNLRLPQVWKLNAIGIVPPYCDEVVGKKLAATKGGKFITEPKEAVCGKEYYVEGGNEELTCQGNYCSGKNACVPFGVGADGRKTNPFCSDKYLTIQYIPDNSVKTFVSDKIGLFGKVVSGAESFVNYRLEESDWLDLSDGTANKLVLLCLKDTEAYVDKYIDFSSATMPSLVVKKDFNNSDLLYYEYLVSYHSLSLQQAIAGEYRCNVVGATAWGFYIKNEFDIDMKCDKDLNAFLYPIGADTNSLDASPYGLKIGDTGGFQPFLFKDFKNKYHFYQIIVTKEMLEKIADDPASNPTPGWAARGTKENFWLKDSYARTKDELGL